MNSDIQRLHSIFQGSVFIGTVNQEVLCSPSDYDISEITPCCHEEADVRIPLHTLHAASHGHTDIFWRTADTDVVLLGVKPGRERRVNC